jgi:Na+-transporting NADH:ubiquinone oxidoreductase subunit NqrC
MKPIEDPRVPSCTCSRVMAGRSVAGLNWHEDCEVHGLGTEWYNNEGKAHFEETWNRAIELQKQAREARAKVGLK